jgi:hypothetical protein
MLRSAGNGLVNRENGLPGFLVAVLVILVWARRSWGHASFPKFSKMLCLGPFEIQLTHCARDFHAKRGLQWAICSQRNFLSQVVRVAA